MEYACDPILQQLAEELAAKRLPPALGSGSPAWCAGRGTTFLQQLVGEIPWGHHMMLLDKVKDSAARLYYLRKAERFGGASHCG